MIPLLLYQVALILIIIRSVYVTVQLVNTSRKRWLDILFHVSVAVVALRFLM